MNPQVERVNKIKARLGSVSQVVKERLPGSVRELLNDVRYLIDEYEGVTDALEEERAQAAIQRTFQNQ